MAPEVRPVPAGSVAVGRSTAASSAVAPAAAPAGGTDRLNSLGPGSSAQPAVATPPRAMRKRAAEGDDASAMDQREAAGTDELIYVDGEAPAGAPTGDGGGEVDVAATQAHGEPRPPTCGGEWVPDPARGALEFPPSATVDDVRAKVKSMRATRRQLLEGDGYTLHHPIVRQLDDDLAQAQYFIGQMLPTRSATGGLRSAERRLAKAQRDADDLDAEVAEYERAYRAQMRDFAVRSEAVRVRIATAKEQIAEWSQVVAPSRTRAPVAVQPVVEGFRAQCAEAMERQALGIDAVAPKLHRARELAGSHPEMADMLNEIIRDMAEVSEHASTAAQAVRVAAVAVDPPSEEHDHERFRLDDCDEDDDEGDEVERGGGSEQGDDASLSSVQQFRVARRTLKANQRERALVARETELRTQQLQWQTEAGAAAPSGGPPPPPAQRSTGGEQDDTGGDADDAL